MIVIQDNYDRFIMHDAMQYKAEKKRPMCECCGNPIFEDFAYRLGGVLYCERCIDASLENIETEDRG